MSEPADFWSDDGFLVPGAGSSAGPTLAPGTGAVEPVPESEAVPASSADSLAPGAGVASEAVLSEWVSAESALSVALADESECALSAVDESEEAASSLAAVEESESAESLFLESAVSEEEAASELSELLLSEESEPEDFEVDELASKLSELLLSELFESPPELSEVDSDALVDAGSAADARVGVAITMTTSRSPHRATARTTILRASGSSRARSVGPMPVTSRRASSKRGTVSPTVLQFQPRGVSR